VFTARYGLGLYILVNFRLDPVFRGIRHNTVRLDLYSAPNIKIKGLYWLDVQSVWLMRRVDKQLVRKPSRMPRHTREMNLPRHHKPHERDRVDLALF
jgi:hypothetical protein